MMRILPSLPILALVVAPTLASAQAMSSAAPVTATTATYSTKDTQLGVLLDDPAAKAVLGKQIPDLIGNEQITMARGMSLKALQNYAGDMLSDEKLAAIDADLAKLPVKK